MPKPKTTYLCTECGESFPTWSGRCPTCGAWNSLTTFREAGPAARHEVAATADFVELAGALAAERPRQKTFSPEIDLVLGGGMVAGSSIVLGGDPGIGKSTLSLQLVQNLPGSFYVAGEESLEQISLRARRLGLLPLSARFSTSTNILEIIDGARRAKPSLLIIDSIQTVYHPDYPSTPGSIVQIRESAMALQTFTKQTGISLILIGHVTKEGAIAGPRLLEHLVDVVLYLEGDKYGRARLLRSLKNRFGPSGEVGVLEMKETGLHDVTDPATVFLEQHGLAAPGRVLSAVLEGNRPFLVEIQALVASTSFATPRRAVSGYDLSRLHLLLAVLEERAGLKLSNRDVYVNIVGGIPVKDRGADIAVALAVASAAKNQTVPDKTAYFGELGLTGEIRPATLHDRRLRAAERTGLSTPPAVKTLKELIQRTLSN